MNYKELPKIELHCHLDGSLRHETILEMAKAMNIETDGKTFYVDVCESLDEYLEKFDIPIQVLQTEENLYRATYELFEDAAKENVKYLEVRFGPLLHLQKGLSLDQVFTSIIAGMQDAERDYEIHGNLILSFLRTMSKDEILSVLDIGSKYLGNGIVGVDLAASELKGFCRNFVKEMDYARSLGYHITIHAGETGFVENIIDAVEILGAERIGHGVALQDHPYMDVIKERDIHIESCPTSNVQTKAVKDLSQHPIVSFLDLSLSINTDNRQVSHTNMTKEIQRVFDYFNIDKQVYSHIYKKSVQHAFASDAIKDRLIALVIE